MASVVVVAAAGDLALLYESWWKTRRSIIYTIAPDRREEEKKVLFDRWVGVRLVGATETPYLAVDVGKLAVCSVAAQLRTQQAA